VIQMWWRLVNQVVQTCDTVVVFDTNFFCSRMQTNSSYLWN